MPTEYERAVIDAAIAKTAEMSPQETDGEWLEVVTAESAPFIREWDVETAWRWDEWPSRRTRFPNTTKRDVGIDVVAVRRDGGHIAIQCKSRKLDADGRGAPIGKDESDSFMSASSGEFWAENWIVVNGDVRLASGAREGAAMRGKRVNVFNIANDLTRQRDAWASSGEYCAHCENPDNPNAIQTKTCMQNEAVAQSVRILREHAESDSGGAPVGEARGRIILPCGTGKTRVSLRIVEELTPPGEVSVVLCPSIALVAQIRREYLQNANAPMDILAVCSDDTAGYNPNRQSDPSVSDDPTLDNGNVSANEVKGKVTTDAGEIAAWLRQPALDSNAVKVLIGTYQSSVRVSQALLNSGVRARVLVADEAHRTAGLKRKNSRAAKARADEKRVRDFTVCHDRERFPATYRVYQTATPRIYDGKRPTRNPDYIVRSMDDETVFGVELYRKSYPQAVRNGWLSDYRIIALGINDAEAYREANELALSSDNKGKNKPTAPDYLRGLAFALAMGGATQGGDVDIQSCIAFMNTVDKSKSMARDLDTESVKTWVANWLRDNAEDGARFADYSLKHLDASSNAAARETAKMELAQADSQNPRGVINVGIFGEGTDSPSLSAVAFLEARKSPIDVVQAVGRAMRTAPGKKMGYIICPILIPPAADPESWLSDSDSKEGWQELGQILLALRAHDSRIEDELGDLISFCLPSPPTLERSILAVVLPDGEGADTHSIHRAEYEGPTGTAEEVVAQAMANGSLEGTGARRIGDPEATYETDEPTQVFTGKMNDDGGMDIRMDSVERDAPKTGEARGVVNIEKTVANASKIINTGVGGTPVEPGARRRKRRSAKERAEQAGQALLELSGFEDRGEAIRMNLLAKSGLAGDRVERDLNILEASVGEAAHHLRADELLPALNRHFGLDRLKTGGKSADGCTVAALMMMNAAMLHQRIGSGGWLPGVSDMALIKNDRDVTRTILSQWDEIMSHDFRPILEPAVGAVRAIESTGKTAGLEIALRHLAAEAELIAETYADMGADHAGPLFNRVMGNQASDGAFFTRPVAASLAARLTLDACEESDEVNWADPDEWSERKIIDLACGSGTLLAATLADMKRRAAEWGADDDDLAELHKLAVEDTIKGLDINPVSLQLAASQLTAGNHDVRYERMGLIEMPYGPGDDDDEVSAGTLELLGQKAIVPPRGALNLAPPSIASQSVWGADDKVANAVEAARNSRIVIMNPPFTNRTKMGEKFPTEIQRALRERADYMEGKLTQADPELVGFGDKTSIEPLFTALADKCVGNEDGVFTMISPTIALTAPSSLGKRLVLAQRWHVHTVLTCHDPKQINLSHNTSINESIIVMRRHDGPKPPTRFINLDKLPVDEGEIVDFHHQLDITRGGVTAYSPTDGGKSHFGTPSALKRATGLRRYGARRNWRTRRFDTPIMPNCGESRTCEDGR